MAALEKRDGYDSRPVPDPTLLTTQQLNASIDNLKESLSRQFKAERDLSEARLLDMDNKVAHLRELHAEKFASIQTQFTERDVRTEQTAKDSKVAVDAALQAAKEAVGEQNKSNALSISKSEAAYTKQIDQIGTQISTESRAANDKIDDIKTRLNLIEGRSSGKGESWGYVVGAVGLIAAVVSLLVALAPHAH